jgi:hypothetical protein
VLTDVRRKVGAAGGVDYSRIPDEDLLAAIDYCIYPNLVGPINAGNWILFRFRPNGDDPNSCMYDVMFLHRFGKGKEAPKVEREFYPSWKDHDGWGPVIGQDLWNMGDRAGGDARPVVRGAAAEPPGDGRAQPREVHPAPGGQCRVMRTGEPSRT